MSVRSGIGARIDPWLSDVKEHFRENPQQKTYLVVALPVLVLTVFFVLPLLFMFGVSLLAEMPPAPLTLEHYIQLVSTDLYATVIFQTAVVTAQTTVLTVIAGYAIAYSMVRFTRRTTLMLLLIILPFWTNYIIRMYAWINILQTGGVLDTMLQVVGLINEPLGILYSHEAVLIGFVYVYLPLAVLPFYASLSNMNESLIDASMDLGAGPLKTFLNVTLPMTKNGIMVGVILVAIPVFGAFITPRILGGVDNQMIGMVIENQFVQTFNWPFGAAMSLVVALFVVVMLAVGIAAGGNLFDLGGEE
jgi:spermidine/putrescine transport system permease protein